MSSASLTSSSRQTDLFQRLEAIATQNKEANKKAHEEWIASKTPAEIYWANSARAALSRLTKVTKRRLTDDRLPKRGPTPWGLYLQSKMRSEGLGDKTPQEKMKILVTEYRALPEAEKEVYCPSTSAFFIPLLLTMDA